MTYGELDAAGRDYTLRLAAELEYDDADNPCDRCSDGYALAEGWECRVCGRT